jgi:hypothetical protein
MCNKAHNPWHTVCNFYKHVGYDLCQRLSYPEGEDRAHHHGAPVRAGVEDTSVAGELLDFTLNLDQ